MEKVEMRNDNKGGRLNEKEVPFTERQLLIMKLWEELENTEEIALKLGVSVNTIVTHLRRMRKKLGVKRTFEVYKYIKEREEGEK